MAKHVILESYTFTPGSRTIVITGKTIRKEQLLLITNTNTGNVIYNFSDPSLNSTSYTNAIDTTTGQETTTIILAYNTSVMNSTDKLAILVEETYTEIVPAEVMRDPVDKLRVSNPQALIDTDFEYGVQPTKWESITLLNNRPSAFIDYTQPITGTANTVVFNGSNTATYQITGISVTSKTVTVTISNANATFGITVGTPIFVQGTLDGANADGWWVVETVGGSNPTYTIAFTVTNTPAATLFDSNKTYIFVGYFYSGAAIPAGTSAFTYSGTTITCTTTNTHGLQVGNGIYVVGTTATTLPPNGSWVVATTPTSNTFTFIANSTPTGTITSVLNASIYPRSLGYVQHRAFDGGVQFSNGSPYQGYQLIRQTRRYFRYQSGKGIQFSTGSILKPTLSIDNVSSSGTTVTVTTKYPHGLLNGAYIIVSGCTETAYNGTFVITGTTATTITYTAGSTPSATPASGNPIVSPYSWYGASNRIGMFDSQNGFYFEFDGQTIYAVKRSSTFQVAGIAAVTNASNTITGTNTKFSSQLKPGDFIVIRGQSYIVQTIASDIQMFIYPEYRGATASSVVISKTINTRYAQSTWNIDKCDGTGTSKLSLDLTKMQMFYADYTWYGAGAIRFGFKNNRGEVIYCHRIPNNNINTEAYMRSGNLPARYETNTIPPWTYLTATLASTVTTGGTISVADTTGWPSSGTVIVTASGNTSAVIEYITYSAKTATSLTVSARAQTGGQSSAQTFTISGATTANPGGTAPIQCELYSPQCASVISHWGSSVIMDGKFDDDKSFVFNFGPITAFATNIAATRFPLLSIRLSPSVDSGSVGLLGVREIINRMQLTLRSVDCYTTNTAYKIELILNARLTTGTSTWSPVGGSSLAQVITHAQADRITGGENIYGFFTNLSAATSQDLSLVRDIGNSILGGGTSTTYSATPVNVYPDGPDIITICATPLTGTSGTINTRISWTEAQA